MRKLRGVIYGVLIVGVLTWPSFLLYKLHLGRGQRELGFAVRSGDVASVSWTMRQFWYVPNAWLLRGWWTEVTPLMTASERGHAEMAAFLISKGASVRQQSSYRGRRLTALHWAQTREVAEILIRHGADPNARTREGDTPLHLLASQEELAEYLIRSGADVNARNALGETPFLLALKASALDHVIHLHTLGADLSTRSQSGAGALHYAAQGKRGDVVEWLIRQGLDIEAGDEAGATPLHYAARAGSARAAGALLAKGAAVGAGRRDGQTPLHVPLAEGAALTGVPALLLAHGANVSARDGKGNTPLFYELERSRRFEVVGLLLEWGADPSATDPNGKTAEELAREYFRIVRRLRLPRGEGLKARDASGDTPLLRAANKLDLELVKVLVARGADVSESRPDGSTPLHLAVRGYPPEAFARPLVAAGADPNARDAEGNTPLHIVAGTDVSAYGSSEHRQEAVARDLLWLGADPTLRNKRGFRPADVAKNPKIADFLCREVWLGKR